MIVRSATEADIPALLEGARFYVEEAGYDLDFSPELSQASLRRALDSDDMALLVAVEEDNLAGAVILSFGREYTVQRFGHITQFYVFPEQRNTDAARRLIEHACRWFDENDCWYNFAASMANINAGRTKAYEDLLIGAGFSDCGHAWIRKAYG